MNSINNLKASDKTAWECANSPCQIQVGDMTVILEFAPAGESLSQLLLAHVRKTSYRE